ncbi:uncharacterized protein [Spinacia oleracea]|uniref:TF-B3 domain-containing protein n=1 Tax=Spinacia oleracea TaxID=3562 RepID=A0ABM3R1Y4_SPIOL|nr:uncharacterized protein LOC130464190 [Spinacia oleracea]XP_056689630.1 uncharacterized protein LOC130464190 [Spinacia oleracea]
MKIRAAYHQAMMMTSNVDPTHPLPSSTCTTHLHLHLHPENPNKPSTDSLNNTIDINSVPVSMVKKRSNALAFDLIDLQDKPNPKKHCFMMKGTNLTLKLLLSEPHRPSDDDDDQNKIINPVPVSMVNNHGVRIFPQNPPIRRSRPKKLKTTSCFNQQDRRHSDDQVLELLRQHINTNNLEFKDVTDAKLILEKKLTDSDLKDDQARLAIPKLQTTEFLTPDEETFLATKIDVNKNNKIDVKVIMESSVYNMCLSRWNYGNNNSNWKYVLKNEWKKLKMDKDLKAGDTIRIVSFRSEKRLNFVILGPKRPIKLQDGSCFKLFGTIMETSPWW